MYGVGTFHIAAFVLCPSMHESSYKHFKNRFSVSYSSVLLQDILPVGQTFRCSYLQCKEPTVGVPDIRDETLSGKIPYFETVDC